MMIRFRFELCPLDEVVAVGPGQGAHRPRHRAAPKDSPIPDDDLPLPFVTVQLAVVIQETMMRRLSAVINHDCAVPLGRDRLGPSSVGVG